MTGPAARVEPVWGVPVPMRPPPPLPRRAEVVIVGGGITGVALLGELLAGGVDTVLVERELVGSGATGRNAGFLLAGVADNYADAVSRYGRSVAAEVWHFTRENHALLASGQYAELAGYARRGSCTVAIDRAEADALEESAVLLKEDGFPVELTPAPPPAVGMLIHPEDGEVHPLALVQAMAAPLAEQIHERHTAVAVTDGTNAASVELSGGAVVEASTVVLACNAWIAELLPSVPIRPVRAQMLAAPATTGQVARPAYAERGHRYWRQLDSGELLVGGFRHRALSTEVGYDLTPSGPVQALLDGQARALGASRAASHRWCGTMGFSPDGLPMVGRPAESLRVMICGGYTGHGMGFAVHAARSLAAQMLSATALPAWLDANRDLTRRG